jgi:hypothetical protein
MSRRVVGRRIADVDPRFLFLYYGEYHFAFTGCFLSSCILSTDKAYRIWEKVCVE